MTTAIEVKQEQYIGVGMCYGTFYFQETKAPSADDAYAVMENNAGSVIVLNEEQCKRSCQQRMRNQLFHH